VQVVALVKQWKEDGWSDEDIMQVTNRSITWLRESLDIIGLDEKCFEAFLREEINRTCAISLSEVKDVRDRQTRLAKMKSKAIERQQAMEQQAQLELEAAEEEAQIAEANAELAETIRAKAETKEKLRKSKKKVKQKEQALREVRSRKPKATGKELDRVRAEHDGASGKHLTLAKYKKHWLPVLERAKQGQVPSLSPSAAAMLQDIMENAFYANQFDLEGFLKGRQQEQPQEKAA
jgi:myosin heavy subunit